MLSLWHLIVAVGTALIAGICVWVAFARRSGRKSYSAPKSGSPCEIANSTQEDAEEAPQFESEAGEQFSEVAIPTKEPDEPAVVDVVLSESPETEVCGTMCDERPTKDESKQLKVAIDDGLLASDTHNNLDENAPPSDVEEQQGCRQNSVTNSVVTESGKALVDLDDAPYIDQQERLNTLCAGEENFQGNPDEQVNGNNRRRPVEPFVPKTHPSTTSADCKDPIGYEREDLDSANGDAAGPALDESKPQTGPDKSAEMDDERCGEKVLSATTQITVKSSGDQCKQINSKSQEDSEPLPIASANPRDRAELGYSDGELKYDGVGAGLTESENPSPAQIDGDLASGFEQKGNQEARSKDTDDTKSTASTRSRRTGPAKYRPSVRTPKTTRRKVRERSNPQTEETRVRSLSMSVHVVFSRSRRTRCCVSLLPSRVEGQDEEIEVLGQSGPEIWAAYQDEWYSDIVPPSITRLLMDGASWDCVRDKSQRWILSGRDIWVLAPAPAGTINGFVSVPRLILQENHLVLCREDQGDAVRTALADAGCNAVKELDDGVPSGWILFQEVKPTTPIHHDDSVGIFNVLRPVHTVEIVFEGGIRLSHANWLRGHPPNIRVRGAGQEIEVLIDQQKASVEGSGGYTAPGWEAPGFHSVFCGGISESYQLVAGMQKWDHFDAFAFRTSWGETDRTSLAICGPIVKSVENGQTIALTPAKNTCLIGSAPGQIAFRAQPYDVRVQEIVTIADFDIVWALPASPLRCDKSKAVVIQLDRRCVEHKHPNIGGDRQLVLRWCHAILDAARKGLSIEPASSEARKLWEQYKQTARRLWRELR